MGNGDNLKATGEVISTIIFIKGVIALIPIIAILLVIALINKGIVSSSIDKNTSILYTDLSGEVCNIAFNNVNINELNVQEYQSSSGVAHYTVDLEYDFKNNNYTAEQYDALIKEEITKIYNKIKDKKIVDDTLFGDKDNVTASIHLSISLDGNYSTRLGSCELRYLNDEGWEKSYQEIMESVIISQERLDNIKI